MRHGILLFSLLVLLAGTAGGVFVLVNQDEDMGGIPQEALVASVQEALDEDKVEAETQEYEAPEAGLQEETDPEPRLLSPAKQPMPAPTPPKSPLSPPPPLPPPAAPTPVPTPQQIEQSQPPPPPPPAEKININTANLEELEHITGVGPAIAQRIIDYRNQNGSFQTIEEIKNVSGIGDVTFEKMKDEITVGDVTPPPPPVPSPTPTPTPNPTPNPPPPAPETEKININTASYEELQEITGVGEVIAQRIIDYRNQNGPFQQIEDIKNVKGIGDVTFEKMKDEITV